MKETADVPVKGKTSLGKMLTVAAIAAVGYLYKSSDFGMDKILTGKEDYSLSINVDSVCARTKAIGPSQSNSVDFILKDAEFKKQVIDVLSGAIQIPTEIQDTNPFPSENPEYYAEFFKFHDYLEEKFPLVHKHLTKELVNGIGLVFTWVGTNPSLKPVLFTAHQDVVPVNRETWGSWTYPPFSGYYDEKTDDIWGRGSIDCKNMLIGELQAIEKLLSEGYKPERGVVLSFGFDEESSGLLGASHLSPFLHDRYGDEGFYALVDEGNPILPLSHDAYVAGPVTAEKGYVDIDFIVHGHGGHSSMPPDHTTIGIASELIALIESNPYPYVFSEENPFYDFLSCYGKYNDEIPPIAKKAILEAPTSEEQKQILLQWLDKVKSMRELMRTSQSADIIHGGIKSNALPEVTSFLINHRIDIFSSVKETVEKDLIHVREIATKFNLGITVNDEVIIPTTDAGFIELKTSKDLEPAPHSPTKGSPVWELFSATIQDVFGNHILADKGKDLFVTTSMSSGNTDTKYYWPLTKNIYRFFPIVVKPEIMGIVHSVNEHISIPNHLSTIAFVYEYILNINEYAAGEP